MTKKMKRKNVKAENQRPKPAQIDESPKSEEIEPENPFDFGGLPIRDLKKNLGCG
jgi:hypothetical protein